jgi:predicted outer membrane repeat protein
MKQLTSLLLLIVWVLSVGQRPLHAADAVVGTGTAASCTEAAFNTALSTVQSSGSGTITFNCGGATTIIFTASKIITNAAVTINGGNSITLSGGNSIRPFYVDSNATLTLQNITLTNGLDNTYGGGAILSLGELTLSNTTIRNSNVDSGHSGGAIMSLGPVTMSNSLIENNSGGSVGGLFLFGEAADATITNSTFRNNDTTNLAYGLGGAITTWNGADLIVRGSMFTENEARYGGAIYNESANTTILIEQNSVLHGNSAFWNGGGIYNSAGEIELNQVTLTENDAGIGGGILNIDGGRATLTQVRFQQNTAYDGGGLYMYGMSEANLFNVTFQANEAGVSGGGLYINSSSASLINVTLRENRAGFGGGIDNDRGSINFINGTVSDNVATDYGGGISNSEGNTALTHVTFSGNSADQAQGGGIYHSDSATPQNSFTLKNVLFNAGENGSNCYVPSDSLSGISSAGFNLSSDYSCSFNQTGDREGVDPRLGPLADNGGFTQTHMLLPDSPAIDAGQCMPGLTTDQRGLPRLQGGACDIGAVEWQAGDGLAKVYLPFVIK